jgi:hypothetical protein
MQDHQSVFLPTKAVFFNESTFDLQSVKLYNLSVGKYSLESVIQSHCCARSRILFIKSHQKKESWYRWQKVIAICELHWKAL